MEQSKPKTILIVEDDEAVRQGIIEVVEAWGWDVLEASNGIHGLALFRDNLPDVVLTDVFISGLDGFQLTAGIKSINRQAAVILMTAFSIPRIHEKVRSVGAIDSHQVFLADPNNSGSWRVAHNLLRDFLTGQWLSAHR